MGLSRWVARPRRPASSNTAATDHPGSLLVGCAAVACALLALVAITVPSASGKAGPYGIAPPKRSPPRKVPPKSPPAKLKSDVPPPDAPASTALTALQRKLNGYINGQGGDNGALVIDETTDRTLWSFDNNTPRLPASVEKLWTTTTALLKFGPDLRLKTVVLGTGKINSAGTFVGTLYLRGGGDPTFGSGEFDHRFYRTGATVQLLASRLRKLGIKRVQGAIVGDASYFDSLHGGPDTHYNANLETDGSLSGLSFDAGFTDFYENQLDANPPLVATQAFALALRAQGITIPATTKITTGRTSAQASILASVQSPPMSKLAELTNSPSNDFFAETLLKDLGVAYGKRGSTAAGATVVKQEIKQRFGIEPQLDDGSGLSRYDRTSPRQVVLLLEQMRSVPSFWNSLAIAARRGTMIDEMKGTSAADNCRGKTGTLHDVANLVGYCTAEHGDRLVFVFMMNGLRSEATGHELEDYAAETLAAYNG